MPHLLLISLGPIQDFIATARRCQDLWFGSWLLSELSRTTAQTVEDQAGSGSVIFPTTTSGPGGERPGVANKILARIPDHLDPRVVAEQACASQRTRLRAVRDLAWNGLDEGFHRATAEAQVEELMEFIWVAVPEKDGYAAARAEAERRLAALKNTRTWAPPPWTPGPGVPKSSLDGERESVVDESVYDKTWTDAQRRERFGVKGKERLCGIGLLKRLAPERNDIFGQRRPPFHSTSHVAMGPTLRGIASTDDGRRAAARYLEVLRQEGMDLDRFRVDAEPASSLRGLDGVLLMESRIDDHLQEKASDAEKRRGKVGSAPDGDAARGALRSLLREADVGEPTPYYAFLVADGDQMGRAIDGMPELAHHQELGGALDRYSASCRGIVDKHHGTLIFAGGDDVIALLPLDTALDCARELADAFVRVIQPIVDAHWKPNSADDNKERPQTTLSVGLGISHAREPMGEALATARRAEKKAKEKRNSLAIIVDRRGGADLTLAGRWEQGLDRRLGRWIELLVTEELSSKAAHDLERVAAHYEALDPQIQSKRVDEIASHARQVLRRKRGSGGAAGATTDDLMERVRTLAADGPPAASLRAMSAELQLAGLLLRARRNARLFSTGNDTRESA